MSRPRLAGALAVALPLAVVALGAVAVLNWLGTPPPALDRRVPGTNQVGVASTNGNAQSAGQLTAGDGVPSTLPGEWPGFRGPERDGVCRASPPLADRWPTNGPPVLWSLDVGEGHAGVAVHKGCVYLHDYDRGRQRDVVRCLSLADGKNIWRFSYPVSVKRNHGMSRTVPAVNDDWVVALGPKCHVTCLKTKTGELLWGKDLVRDFGTTVPPWYAGQCPLIDGGRVILAPCGDTLMMAVDGATGKVVWTAPNPNGWRMTHSSIMPVEIDGVRMYVYCGSGGVAGLAAEDGKLLWSTSEWKISIANVPTPVPVGQGRLFVSGGYNAGAAMLQVKRGAAGFETHVLFRLPATVFGADQQTPIFYNGKLYGVRPGGELVCLGLDGKIVWTSGTANRYGIGPYTIADGKVFVMNDAGLLSVVRASPDGFALLGKARVLEGHDSWGPMAIAGDRLIARDLTRVVCLDIGKKIEGDR